MKKRTRIVLASVLALSLVGAFALFGCSSGDQKAEEPQQQQQEPQQQSEGHEAVELQLFAANSLSKAMDAVQALYVQDHDWVTFKDTQYLSSGELNEQLAGGAYADVLISASKAKMDEAVDAGYVDAAMRFDMFKNDLVMVVGENSELADKDFTLEDIATGDYTVAVGDDSVPAGNYANQALSTVGCYVDASGKSGSDISGKEGSYDGTPLEGKVNLQSLGRQRLQTGRIGRRGRRVRVQLGRLPFRRRESGGQGSGRHAQEHRVPLLHLHGFHERRSGCGIHRMGDHRSRGSQDVAGVGLRAGDRLTSGFAVQQVKSSGRGAPRRS